uniref:Uncharacterized protein n=1 Tax=Rousettus aegyptiacus TaxID=9407 RepID=A0A7J8E925_ROUAE|nr:hypothetical protein HJG63_008260 [Rousettus aegyptiacus]
MRLPLREPRGKEADRVLVPDGRRVRAERGGPPPRWEAALGPAPTPQCAWRDRARGAARPPLRCRPPPRHTCAPTAPALSFSSPLCQRKIYLSEEQIGSSCYLMARLTELPQPTPWALASGREMDFGGTTKILERHLDVSGQQGQGFNKRCRRTDQGNHGKRVLRRD